LLLEVLEDRTVPTAITPTTFADGVLGSGSLRDAVLQFNADTGTDDDTIQLEAGTYSLTIQNVGGHHETAGLTGDLNLTQTSHHWIIQGTGPSTIIDASALQDRAFQIVNSGTQVVFKDLVIQGGLAQEDGTNGTLAGTTDALGGGILNNGGNVTLDNVILQNNVARGGDAAFGDGHNARGGGIHSTGGALSMAGAMIANNQAIGGRGADYYGGGLGNGGSARGGGLYASGGSLDISESTIASNQATGGRGGDGFSTPFGGGGGGIGGSGEGGGLYLSSGSLTIASSTIATNQGTGGSAGYVGWDGTGRGGGLYNGGTLTVNNSTLSGNTATSNYIYYYTYDSFGGGIANYGTLTVNNSTLSGNTASTTTPYYETFGGGIANYGTLTVSNSTLSGNTASGHSSFGGSIANFGTLHARNTIIAGNTAPSAPDVNGNLGSQGHNLIGNTQGASGFDPTDILNINPLLGPLQDNGGPTKTMALLAGSPALNAGDPSQLGVADQRGVLRRGGVNIGAYQASASVLVVTVSGTVASGTPFDVTMQAVDEFGQVAFGYRGTVNFSVTDPDPAVMLPADYTFSADDQGTHRFTGEFTLITPGTWTLTAADLANALSQGVMVTVDS
jgi:hypothetical protein